MAAKNKVGYRVSPATVDGLRVLASEDRRGIGAQLEWLVDQELGRRGMRAVSSVTSEQGAKPCTPTESPDTTGT